MTSSSSSSHRRGRLSVAIAFALAATMSLAATAQAAPIDSPNATCRKAISKGLSKLGSTAMKAFDGCVKSGLKNLSGNCSTAALADLKSKIPAAAAKLSAGIAASCSDAGTPIALSEHVRCGPPIGTPIATFTDVDSCLNQLTVANIEDLRNALMNPDFAAASPAAATCINAIGKNASKLFKTIQKEKSKAIAAADKLGQDSEYNDPGDPQGKIGAATSKADAAILAACSPLAPAEWGFVRSCAESAGSVSNCILEKVAATAGGLMGSGFDQPGICPSSARLTFHKGAQGGAVVSGTELDLGFVGFGHDLELTGDADFRFALDCGATSNNDCTACNASATCAEGNCRCANDTSLLCDQPFGADVDDCGGNLCRMFFGPPQPWYVAGTPVCTLNDLSSDLSGAINAATGETSVQLSMRSRIHLGIEILKPCPTCDAGVCDGGDRNGLACTIDGTYSLGNVSYDCPPSAGSNITGTGLPQTQTLSDAAQSLPFSLPCDAPLGGFSCACSSCSLDNTIPCNSNAECAAAFAGVCRTDGLHGGAARKPNSCSDVTCEDAGNEEGECSGEFDTLCDGYVAGDGKGLVSCASNADCEPIFTGSGNCTLNQTRPCFLNPIDVVGTASAQGPVLGAAYCIPPAANASVNGVFGLPGPARVKYETELTAFCSDGVTPWQIGGAACP